MRGSASGLGSGIHLCFGGPPARRETQIALLEPARCLDRPRLVADPPPAGAALLSAFSRGSLHLHVERDTG
ncbi:hypothetical protein ACLMNJ_15680 [Streptomyces seoulensis]